MTTDVCNALTSKGLKEAVASAVKLLGRGQVVALPTETVYGLAADATKSAAVAKIFAAKQRPLFDPLIVHLPDESWLERVARIPAEDADLIKELLARFWPGPFSIVLPKRKRIPDLVTSGLETVALRRSAHPVFDAIIRKFDRPLAAPSANRFGRISPTLGAHVMTELSGRIPLMVDGGPTMHGLESTIVAARAGRITILRSGPITAAMLGEFGKVVLPKRGAKAIVPGQLKNHYAPRTRLRIVPKIKSFTPPKGRRTGLLAWQVGPWFARYQAVEVLSRSLNFEVAATRLFAAMRELDEAGLDLIVAEAVPEENLGVAIMDRLRRAAAR